VNVMSVRHTHRLLLLGLLLQGALFASITAPVARAQSEIPDPPSAGSDEPIPPMIEETRQSFDRVMTASDGGNREGVASFRLYYDFLCSQVYLETVMNKPRAATTMARELDKWLADKAQGGSPTAQFWMAERAGIVGSCSNDVSDVAEAERWYRASAEQGFAPAQSALGQILIMGYEFRREPFEPEKWLLQAVRQGEVRADQYLLWAIDVDSIRPGYAPSPEIFAWLQQQSDAGDEKAKRILTRLAPKN